MPADARGLAGAFCTNSIGLAAETAGATESSTPELSTAAKPSQTPAHAIDALPPIGRLFSIDLGVFGSRIGFGRTTLKVGFRFGIG